MSARWYASPMSPLRTASRLDVRFTLTSPSSTQGVPPMRSRVEKAYPLQLPLDPGPRGEDPILLGLRQLPDLEAAPPMRMSAISSRSASVSAVLSLVSTWIAIV